MFPSLISKFVFFSSDNITLDEWILAKKPTEKKSAQIYGKFMERAQFDGSEEFRHKIIKIVDKSSRLATGYAILKRYLKYKKHIKIKQLDKSMFSGKLGLCFGFLGKKNYYVSINCEGEKELVKQPNVAIFLHEIVHACHFYKNKHSYKKRLLSPSFYDAMHNQEEELTIKGSIHGHLDLISTVHNENCVLKELNFPRRENHLGYQILKNANLTLFDMMRASSLGSLKNELKVNPELVNDLEVPLDIQNKCYGHFPDLQFSVKYFIDLVIFIGEINSLKLFIGLGWKPEQKHLEKGGGFLSLYQKLIEDQKINPNCPILKTHLSLKQLKINYAQIQECVDFLEKFC
jgi:hypothetical protein